MREEIKNNTKDCVQSKRIAKTFNNRKQTLNDTAPNLSECP